MLVALGVALALLGGCGGSDGSDSPEPAEGVPNILFVLIDDADKSMYSEKTMPFTWRYMHDHATTFTDYIVTSPLCCPARASIISGQYGHNNGVLENSYGDLHDPANVLPVWMQQAGYKTAHIGKFLNNYGKTLDTPSGVTPGWDEWFTQLEPQRYFDYQLSDDGDVVKFGDDDSDYLTRVLGEHASGLIDQFGGEERPFYMELDEFAPHFAGGQTGRCRGAAEPDPLDAGTVTSQVPRTPAFFEADRSDKPSFIRSLPPATAALKRDEDRRYTCALESLKAIDRSFQQVIDKLNDDGLLESTVVVFSSDNGNYYGQHAIPDEKQFPYRTAYEVPFQIALPEAIAGEQPQQIDAPVASIDIAPTFLDLASGEPCTESGACRVLDGRSLLPLLNGEESPGAWANRVRGIELTLEQNNEPYDRVCEFYGVRSGRWAFVHHVTAAKAGGECRPSGEDELYDLAADPYELQNVAAEKHRTVARMRQEALTIRRCEGAPDSGSPHPCG